MGQYYKAIFLEDKASNDAPETIIGIFDTYKLMQESWIDFAFTRYIEANLVNEGRRIVLAGDYADAEPNSTDNLYVMAMDMVKENLEINVSQTKTLLEHQTTFRYIINHTKKQYVDKDKVMPNDEGSRIHPLTILTSEGNGRGGGDYRGDNQDLAGTWSRNKISVSNDIPDGYEELITNFKE